MTAKWQWIPLISGALVVPFAGQTRLQAADARHGLRDYLKKEMPACRKDVAKDQIWLFSS